MANVKKFEKEGYAISVNSKNVSITEAIEKYVLEKISKVERFTPHILNIAVTLEVQKVTHHVSIRMKFSHFTVQVQARTENLYSAIDMAVERLIKIVQKYKKKMQSHKVKAYEKDSVKVRIIHPVSYTEEINEQIEDETLSQEEELYKIHEVVSEETLPVKMFTQEEAALRLELSKEPFIVYKSEEDQKRKLLYKRKDKKLGLISIE